MGVIAEDNFYFTGTLRENISWGVDNFDSARAELLAEELQLEQDLQNYDTHKL